MKNYYLAFAFLFISLVSCQEETYQDPVVPEEELSPIKSYADTHGLYMFLGWGILFDISLFAIKYGKGLKKTPPFQFLHSLPLYITYTLSMIAGIKMINRWREEDKPITVHGVFGIIVLVLSTLSILGGMGLILKVKDTKGDADTVEGRKRHAIGGYLLYILSRLALVSGVGVKEPESIWVVLVYFVLVFGLHGFVSKRQKDNFHEYHPIKDQHSLKLTQDQSDLVSKINLGVPKEELIKQYPKLKWVIYGNNIVDITDWLHPGGVFLTEETLGREVSQFLTGAQTIEAFDGKIKPYTHSKRAYEFIETAVIGLINDKNSAILDKDKSDSRTSFLDQWKIQKIEKMTPKLSSFSFYSYNYKTRSMITRLRNLGKHYLIKFENKLPARPYTTAFSLDKNIQVLREAVFNSLISGQQLSLANFNSIRDTLPLFIKKYSFENGFSKQIHQAEPQKDNFLIEGPLGTGLEINSDSKGNYYFICGGTGILLFADFLNYLFFKECFEILKKEGRLKDAETIKSLGFDFDESFRDLKINLIAAFSELEEAYGYDIISKLALLEARFKRNNFNAVLTSTKSLENITTVMGLFDADLLRKHVSNPDKIFVCGPPKFNASVPIELSKLNIEKSKIIFI